MKALSIWEPWAWLIVHGFKPVENRCWPTRLRGPVLIHASKTVDVDAYAWLAACFPVIARQIPPPARLQRGGIVGRATLIDCVTDHSSPFFFGPYGFVMTDPVVLPFRPLRVLQRFFEVPHAP